MKPLGGWRWFHGHGERSVRLVLAAAAADMCGPKAERPRTLELESVPAEAWRAGVNTRARLTEPLIVGLLRFISIEWRIHRQPAEQIGAPKNVMQTWAGGRGPGLDWKLIYMVNEELLAGERERQFNCTPTRPPACLYPALG